MERKGSCQEISQDVSEIILTAIERERKSVYLKAGCYSLFILSGPLRHNVLKSVTVVIMIETFV